MTRKEALAIVEILGNWWGTGDEDQVRDAEEIKTVNQALKLLRSDNERSNEE